MTCVPDIFSTIQQPRQRPTTKHTSAEIFKLEDEFLGFKNHVLSSEWERLDVVRFRSCCWRGGDTFAKAWYPFQKG